ncbi:MAG: MMPL family transporter [Bdellovibrionales bacterium]|nr:MMPL family transporter [Bdellovibrionales bacterium]
MHGITRFIIRRAGWVTAAGLVLTVLGGYFSVHLFSNLRTEIEELLPAKAQSVLDVNEVRSRLESTNSMSVLFISNHPDASKRFVDDFAAKVNALPPDVAAGAEYRINKELEFFNSRKSLFITQTDLNSIKNYIKARINYEIQLYNPLTIIENRDIPEPKLDFEALKRKYIGKADAYAHFKSGYYASADEKMRVVLVNQPGGSGGIDASKKLQHALTQIITELDPKKYADDLEYHYAGGVQDMIEEHEALIEDLSLSIIVVCVLVGLAMLQYFRSFTGTFCLIMALVAGTLWTFGVGLFQVGYLNANSAFMGSIIIGNGINFGIILLARYMEERRKRKATPRAIAIAMERTFSATGAAAGAAGLAYGSLILTSFRGFHQFGIIGLTGMILCWAASYTLMPAMLVMFYRMGGLRRPVRSHNPVIANFLAWLVQKFPKPILIFTGAITIVSILLLGRLDSNIIETDMKKLRNKHSSESGSMYWGKFVDDIFGRYLAPIVVLPKNRADVEPIANEIRKAKEAQGPNSFIVNVSTIHDFLPPNQPEKIKVLQEIDRLLPPRLLNRLGPNERAMAKDLLSPNSFKRFEENELPELVKSKFREKDGTLGKLVLIEPSLSPELSKIENMQTFVHSIREATYKIRPGTAVAGTLMVTTDLFESIVKDGPKATLFAFVAVFLLVILLFRNLVTIAQCSFALLLGVLWLAGFILEEHFKINFLNFIALPITFGIGVDYGVNIFQRYKIEKSSSILNVLRHTGGAVMLASLTTITGYGSLLIASNQAFVSFGTLAIVGEVTCIFAAVVSLPAFLWYLEQKNDKKRRKGQQRSHERDKTQRTNAPQSSDREGTLA